MQVNVRYFFTTPYYNILCRVCVNYFDIYFIIKGVFPLLFYNGVRGQTYIFSQSYLVYFGGYIGFFGSYYGAQPFKVNAGLVVEVGCDKIIKTFAGGFWKEAVHIERVVVFRIYYISVSGAASDNYIKIITA